MDYTNRLANVAVVGAAGKMGSGILLLAATELTRLHMQPENRDKTFVVHAIDVSHKALEDLMRYVRIQARKMGEKQLVPLRNAYAGRDDLPENADIIQQYVEDVLLKIKPTTRLEAAYDANLVFEAASENPKLKTHIFKQINTHNTTSPWFFTNTSSIPIEELNEKAELDGRIIGFHFYNPPAVQKLVEIIRGKSTRGDVAAFASQYAAAMGKIVVPSADIAGFIGNGYLMRDALYGIHMAGQLGQDIPFPQAVYIIDKITRDYLIRPMGIFQLIDYVGIDVVQYIMQVMNERLSGEELHSRMLDTMLQNDVTGGQYAGGSQKDGFFRYEKGKPVAVYDPDNNDYAKLEAIKEAAEDYAGPPPVEPIPWKKALRDKSLQERIPEYFKTLAASENQGARLAVRFAANTKAIGRKLVHDGVAQTENDFNTVLMRGFFHAFGPVSNFIPEPETVQSKTK